MPQSKSPPAGLSQPSSEFADQKTLTRFSRDPPFYSCWLKKAALLFEGGSLDDVQFAEASRVTERRKRQEGV